MRAVEHGREWEQQPDRCVLMLDNARIHGQVALARVRAAAVVVLLFTPCSRDFNLIGDVFSVSNSWLRRWSSAEEDHAWPILTINSMLKHTSGDMCRASVTAAVRRYNLYVP
eukprot:TRINITY_DN4374_c0_g1_i1.p2 TRINITY_DN4374_c0_g1~~TRINITY_DN4374_c0_g1_i1.p2  ORF type:complete len:112 (+),score=8.01 TRINITY_DN4374_c0_g1_i1:858-1193(+)